MAEDGGVGKSDLHMREVFFENGHIGWLQLIGSFCVAGHHAGIADLGSKVDCAGTSTLSGRMKKCIPSIRHPQRYLINSTCLDVDHLNTLSYCDWRKVCGSIFKKTR